jgi:hypothetical protein
MRPDHRQNQKLIKQFPFLRAIIASPMEPFGYPAETHINHITDLMIKVQRADGDLMYRQASNIGLGDCSFYFSVGGKRSGQVSRQAEYLFGIDSDLEIRTRVTWPRNSNEGGNQHPIYGYHALWATRDSKGWMTNLVASQIKYLVWVSIQTWHQDTKNDDFETPGARFGQFLERNVDITVYVAPKEGFEKLEENSCVEENLCLDRDAFIRAFIDKNERLIEIHGRLAELCTQFQDDVYFNGMRDIFNPDKNRGASGQFGSIEVLCAEMCGYERIMLQDSGSWISMQLRPESKSLYVLGMNGTLPRLRELIRNIIKAWNSSPETKNAFKVNNNVSVL